MLSFRKIIVGVIAVAVLSLPALGQHEDRTTETKAEVPELTEFHTVIYQLWHTAWPEKNIALMVELVPEIEKHTAAVVGAELPGILRDKKRVWKKNVADLNTIVSQYKIAAAAGDTSGLLAAGEKLHAQFEKLVRTIRPVLKEIDEFHAVLYMLYHHYMPAQDGEKISAAASQLKEKMTALEKATLPARLKKRETEFLVARLQLGESVDLFSVVASTSDMKLIEEKLEALHSNYQALEKVFD